MSGEIPPEVVDVLVEWAPWALVYAALARRIKSLEAASFAAERRLGAMADRLDRLLRITPPPPPVEAHVRADDTPVERPQ